MSRLSALVVPIVLALALTSCTGDESGQEASPTTSEAGERSTATPDPSSASSSTADPEPRPGDRVRGFEGVEDAPVSAVLPRGMHVVSDLAGARRFDTQNGDGTILYGIPAVVFGGGDAVRATDLDTVIDTIRRREDLRDLRVRRTSVGKQPARVLTYEALGTEGEVITTWRGGEPMQPLPGVTTTVLVSHGDQVLWVNFESNTGERKGVPEPARRNFLRSIRFQ